MTAKTITTYAEFWRFYVGEHRNKGNRYWHFFGTNIALLCLVAAIYLRNPFLALFAFVLGYAPAWIGHFFWERNRPATFRYPLWSLVADMQMYALMWRGRMDQEVARVSLLLEADKAR